MSKVVKYITGLLVAAITIYGCGGAKRNGTVPPKTEYRIEDEATGVAIVADAISRLEYESGKTWKVALNTANNIVSITYSEDGQDKQINFIPDGYYYKEGEQPPFSRSKKGSGGVHPDRYFEFDAPYDEFGDAQKAALKKVNEDPKIPVYVALIGPATGKDRTEAEYNLRQATLAALKANTKGKNFYMFPKPRGKL